MPELTHPSPLLQPDGSLTQVGWSRHPLLDCNLERAAFYPGPLRFWQKMRLKRWDYYALFTPKRFFAVALANLGYAANVFAYLFDYTKREFHEESRLALPRAVRLPRDSDEEHSESCYQSGDTRITFRVESDRRLISVDWPAFDHGKGLRAELALACPPQHESMNIVIPFSQRRFYLNRKINCLPAEGILQWGELREEVAPTSSLGQLDWGCGIWPYRSYWNWASASGFLYRAPRPPRWQPEPMTVGLNLGTGFGDTSAATENALILDGRIHKLDQVEFIYDPRDYTRPWLFRDNQGRLDLMFTPFYERVARTRLPLLSSEVHQLFGRYEGRVITDNGEEIQLQGLVGFAEEHHAQW